MSNRMGKYIFSILVIGILFLASTYIVFTRHHEVRPMSYVYNVPIQNVRESIDSIFSNGNFHGLDFQVGYDSAEIDVLNSIGDSIGNNGNHFFINRFRWGSTSGDSEIYYNVWGQLKLIPNYHIVLDSISDQRTKITIKSFPQVEAGTGFSFNHMTPYLLPRKVEVMPSTIEEYEIIRMIGERSGEKF